MKLNFFRMQTDIHTQPKNELIFQEYVQFASMIKIFKFLITLKVLHKDNLVVCGDIIKSP